MEFGEAMKDNFCLDKSCAFVNHGAYGPTPKAIVDQKVKFIYEQEKQPDEWFRSGLSEKYDASITAAAEFLGAKKENLVLVDNVTTGINTVIKCLKFEPGDKILLHTHSYNAVKNIIKEQEDFRGVGIVMAEIPIPIKSEDHIVEVFRKAIVANSQIKVAVLDHISSASAILFPVKKLIKLCREQGIVSVIDGAHAPGQVKLNLEELGADYYSANFHKWCYVPRSCGFIWISPEHRGKIRPLVTSHGYKHGIDEEFSNLGTRDTSAHFCIPHALQFYKDIGGLEAIQAHAKKMLKYAVDLLTKSLGTEELDIPDSMRAPYMTTVRLPIAKPATLFGLSGTEGGAKGREIVNKKSIEIYKAFNVMTIFVYFNDTLFVRLSANIYNTKQDYDRLNDVLLKTLAAMQSKKVSEWCSVASSVLKIKHQLHNSFFRNFIKYLICFYFQI